MKILTRRIIYYPFSKQAQTLVQPQSSSRNNLKKHQFIPTPNPRFIAERIKYFSEIKARNDHILSSIPKPEITITLKDGRTIQGRAFQTTPMSLTKMMPRQIGENALVAKVIYSIKHESPFSKGVVSTEPQEQSTIHQNYELVDMNRPLQGDCTLQLINFDEKIGKEVFWHSSSHLLGQSLEKVFGAWLCHGPYIEPGFFYDSFIGNYTVSQTDYEKIQKEVKQFAREKQIFERTLLTKQQALDLFCYNPFKLELINHKIPDGGLTTVYRCGNLVDLCTGPHIPSSDKVKGFKITKNSSAYWHGHKDKDCLQRVYGVSFPKQNQLDQHIKLQEQLAKKDHRYIGMTQQLFSFSNLTPGSPFFHSHGTTIFNRLIDLLRSQYKIRGYQEVITPNIFHSQLWKISGHYYKYKEHIYFMKEGHSQEQHGLKPMNCPGHCIMFGLTQHSYKDLPIRMADFGVLHRNELHGALSGLTRVRRFQQDDAHIFCMYDQILPQILAVLDLLDYVYSLFGFKYTLQLSTRPEKFLGSIQEWDMAERQLKEALEQFKGVYRINEGDGAFYGPKIDVKLTDVFGRQHQCGTIQLDFQLPIRFDLQYRTSESAKSHEEYHHEHKSSCDHSEVTQSSTQASGEEKYGRERPLKQGFARPVIIHRAILGSLERFIAILCEQTGGKWDFWLSPRQLKLVTIGTESHEYAEKIYKTLLLQGYSVELDTKGDNLNKKIRNAQLQGFNYIGVIGKEQTASKTINLRKRDETKEMGSMTVENLIKLFEAQRPPKSKLRLRLENESI